MRDILARWLYEERGHMPDYLIPFVVLLSVVVLLVDSLVGHPLVEWGLHFAERLVE